MAIRTPEEQEAYKQDARKMVEYEAKLDKCIVRDQVQHAQICTSILIDMMPMPPHREGRKESTKKQPIKKVSPAAIQKCHSAGFVESNTADVRLRQRDSIRLPPGLVVNKRYRIVNRVGAGSFSTVFKAADTHKNNSAVIMKVAWSPYFDSKYEAEVNALKKCGGISNFPTLFDHFKLGKVSFIVESDAGEELYDVLTRCEKFSNENTIRIGYSIMKALAHLHQCGILHMDLNNGNVTLKKTNEGKMKVFLIDFGNSSPSRPWEKVDLRARYISLAVIRGKFYQEVDDLTSGVYLISCMTGTNVYDPLNTQSGYIEGKTLFHSNPAKYFSFEKSWIPKLLEFCDIRDQDPLDMKPVWQIFENAVESVKPTSDIVYSIKQDKVYIA